MLGLTKTFAREFASRSITSNAVAPGFIASEMTSKIDKKYEDAILATIPLGGPLHLLICFSHCVPSLCMHRDAHCCPVSCGSDASTVKLHSGTCACTSKDLTPTKRICCTFVNNNVPQGLADV